MGLISTSLLYLRRKFIQTMILVLMVGIIVVGEMYALFGPSGSGKTTCLSLLGGLDEPDFGKVLLDGKDIKEIGPEKLRREHVAYIFQDYQLFPYMTALENVMAAERIWGVHLPRRHW